MALRSLPDEPLGLVYGLQESPRRPAAGGRHLATIEDRVLSAVTVLPFDGSVAQVYGRLAADLADGGQPLADADLQKAATALHHGLELVTGNIRHYGRIPDLRIRPLRHAPRHGSRAGRGGGRPTPYAAS